MTDLELVKACAEAITPVRTNVVEDFGKIFIFPAGAIYDPLHDDAQAMALVKKFQLSVGYSNGWCARKDDDGGLKSGAFHQPDLNRAICECVAKLSTRTPA